MDIRVAMMMEIADAIHAHVLSIRCDRCDFPLLEKPEQAMPFCWGCTTDRRTALDGRTLLLRARLAEQGIIIPREPACRAAEKELQAYEPQGPFKFGMPL